MSGLPRLGNYETVRVIASGGMGLVVEVTDRATGASFAAKVIRKAENATARDRFRREAELLARCDRHPGIVKVHAIGDTASGPYMILDLIRGESLDALLDRETKLEPRRAASIVRDVARALGFAHARGITHRDVKPGNILLDESGTPRLTDFGLATARDVERLTVSGTFLGTPRYMSPEQATGAGTGPASDVFSLGCVLFHALAGRPPIEADSVVGLLAELASDEPLDPVTACVPGVPVGLAAIVARALAKDAASRYEHGDALADELDAFLEGKALSPDPGHTRRSAALVLRGLAVAAAVLASTALTLGLVRNHRRNEAVTTAHDELARARAALDRAAAPDLAGARDHARRASLARDLARDSGADQDGTLDSALTSIAADLALAEARESLARGDAAAALAAIDATPGAPAALGEPAHVLRARALHALGREDDALGEVKGRSGPEPLETAGDILVALDRPGEAGLVYTRALPLVTPQEGRRLRAKRGGAAALAGDGGEAASDLKALLGEPISLNATAIATVGSIAPAVYLRALAATEPKAQRPGLDAAWRLGPPPRSLAAAVAHAWVAQAAAETLDWFQSASSAIMITEERAKTLEEILARAGRARGIDPTVSLRPVDDAVISLLPVVLNTDEATTPLLIDRMRRLRGVLPGSTRLQFLFAAATRHAESGSLPESVAALNRAIDLSSDPAPDDEVERRFACDEAELLAQIGGDAFITVDEEHVRLAARRADCARAWLAVAQVQLRHARLEGALDSLARASAATNTIGTPVAKEELALNRAGALARLGRLEDAIAVARELHEGNRFDPTDLVTLAGYLERAGRWDEILGLVDPSSREKSPIGPMVVAALSKKGRAAEARALAAKLTLAKGAAATLESVIAVDETERTVAELLAHGKAEEAIALARRIVASEESGWAAVTLLAATLNRCGRPEEAVAAVPPEASALAQLEKGLALVKVGNLDSARAIVAQLKKDGSAYEARPIEAALAARDR
jgi:hypothetical protein